MREFDRTDASYDLFQCCWVLWNLRKQDWMDFIIRCAKLRERYFFWQYNRLSSGTTLHFLDWHRSYKWFIFSKWHTSAEVGWISRNWIFVDCHIRKWIQRLPPRRVRVRVSILIWWLSILKKIWMENWLTAMIIILRRVSVKFSTGQNYFISGMVKNFFPYKYS